MKRSIGIFLLNLAIIGILFSGCVQAEEKTKPEVKKVSQTVSKIPAPLTWPRLLENEKGNIKGLPAPDQKMGKGGYEVSYGH